MSGYTDCACRDCFEIAIGEAGQALCRACEEYGCSPDGCGCEVNHCEDCGCWRNHPDDCRTCEHRIDGEASR